MDPFSAIRPRGGFDPAHQQAVCYSEGGSVLLSTVCFAGGSVPQSVACFAMGSVPRSVACSAMGSVPQSAACFAGGSTRLWVACSALEFALPLVACNHSVEASVRSSVAHKRFARNSAFLPVGCIRFDRDSDRLSVVRKHRGIDPVPLCLEKNGCEMMQFVRSVACIRCLQAVVPLLVDFADVFGDPTDLCYHSQFADRQCSADNCYVQESRRLQIGLNSDEYSRSNVDWGSQSPYSFRAPDQRVARIDRMGCSFFPALLTRQLQASLLTMSLNTLPRCS